MATDPNDMQEFVRLLTNHQEMIRSYIIGQMPGCPDVPDVLQEVNILLWNKMNEFKIGTNFGAWACTVAYYKVLDHRKKMAKSGFLEFNDELASRLSQDQATRESETLSRKRRALRHCFSKLAPKDQLLLNARYQDDKVKMDELAEQTGRPNASLRVSLSRLRKTLRDCINYRINQEKKLS